ncbi:MAG: hypothetical protein AAGE85_10645 [Pseudomonadota bacterium]
MTVPEKSRIASIWLPFPAADSWAGAGSLLRWLCRGDFVQRDLPEEPLDSLLRLLGRRAPASGRAALRFYGQTGDKPRVWMAAADPVYLEPRLDHLFLHSLSAREFDAPSLRALFDHLHTTLASGSDADYARVGGMGYLRSDEPFDTAGLSASAVDQRVPNDWMPRGESAAAYRRQLSEIEMALHEHPVNAERMQSGRFPVNSLWLWGGGTLPELHPEPLPPLFCNDPLLLGFWRLNDSRVAGWPGSIDGCLEAAAGSFAAQIPFAVEHVDELQPALVTLRRALVERELDEVRLFFATGAELSLRRGHRWRWWRRVERSAWAEAGGLHAADS